jgi:hypothetical protein
MNINLHLSLLTVILGCLGASCLFISGVIFTQEIGEVNRKLPDDQQISYWGIYTEKFLKIKQLYKHFYPNGWLHRLRFIFEIVGFVLLAVAAYTSGFFRGGAFK